jgi:RNA polymerase sigma-70 factor (ECF subfamily)
MMVSGSSALDSRVSEYVDRIQKGEEEAFERLYETLKPLVLQRALRVLKNRPDAEDVVQLVFIRVWKCIDQWNPARGAFMGWFNEITKNIIIDVLRKNRKQRAHYLFQNEILDEEYRENLVFETKERVVDSPHEEVERKEIIERVMETVEGFVDSRKRPWKARYLDHLNVREVADLEGKNENTVKVVLHRINRDIRNKLNYLWV